MVEQPHDPQRPILHTPKHDLSFFGIVIPADAGIQLFLRRREEKKMDPRFGGDGAGV
jgi:hypothetical protein